MRQSFARLLRSPCLVGFARSSVCPLRSSAPLIGRILLVIASLGWTGCSVITVKGPPPAEQRPRHFEGTSSYGGTMFSLPDWAAEGHHR
jgi:hypothetical protein